MKHALKILGCKYWIAQIASREGGFKSVLTVQIACLYIHSIPRVQSFTTRLQKNLDTYLQ